MDAAGVAYTVHLYKYVEKGGTGASSAALGVPEHQVIKTLVMQDESRTPLVVLMHGDRQVSTRALARQIGAKTVHPCSAKDAQKYSGYAVGGTSPFGLKRSMTVYWESSIGDLERLFINGGKRGQLVSMAPSELLRVVSPIPVEVATTT